MAHPPQIQMPMPSGKQMQGRPIAIRLCLSSRGGLAQKRTGAGKRLQPAQPWAWQAMAQPAMA
eukprot:7120840-Alexandrium_andersonii.AAC.1